MTRWPLLLTLPFVLGLRSIPCAHVAGCGEAMAQELSGASDLPLIDDAYIQRSYERTIWVMVVRYEQTLGDWYLDAAQRTLTDYATDYPAGQAWRAAVRPLIQQVQAARTVPEQHRFATQLRKAVEARLTPAACP